VKTFEGLLIVFFPLRTTEVDQHLHLWTVQNKRLKVCLMKDGQHLN